AHATRSGNRPYRLFAHLSPERQSRSAIGVRLGVQASNSVSEIPVPPPQSPGGPASSGGPSRVVNPLAAGDDGGTSPAELISGRQHTVEGCVSDHPEAGVPHRRERCYRRPWLCW